MLSAKKKSVTTAGRRLKDSVKHIPQGAALAINPSGADLDEALQVLRKVTGELEAEIRRYL